MAIYTDKSFFKEFGHDYYDNTSYVSNSMIKAYQKDIWYFNRKYNMGMVQSTKSKDLIIGSLVDHMIFDRHIPINDRYEIVKRRSKKSESGLEQVNISDYNKALGMYARIKKQPICQSLEEGDKQWEQAVSQPILTNDKLRIKGKLDWLQLSVDGKRARIIDLKTSQTIDPYKYHWHCEKFGYYQQMALYTHLVSINYGMSINSIDFYHLTVEKDKDDINHCRLFKLQKDDINGMILDLLETAKEIQERVEWPEQTVDWGDVVVIGDDNPDNEFKEL